MVNSEKNPMFTLEERVELIKKVTARFPNVEVDTSDKLLVDYADSIGNAVIVKGLRAVSDFEMEFQMAMVNKKINPELDTVFLTAGEKYTFLSSTVVKEMAKYGADLHEFVPMEIIDDVINKTKSWR
jgi:pantetheine-phosphate adenylyltransferase